jgi:hypothetical protein
MGVERPQVNLEMDRVVCGIHGEPFRAKWPEGYPTFAVEVFHAVAQTGVFSDVGEFKINRMLKTKPLCCRLKEIDPAKLVELYTRTSMAVTAVCSRCALLKPGAPYKYNDPRSNYGHLTLTHLCFECVVYRLVAAPGRSN